MEDVPGPSAALPPLARARLDDLLEELLQRVGHVMDTQDRLRGLLDAVVGIAADLSLDSVLQRIVTVASRLADARYGALGVLGSGPDRRLKEFVTYGITPEERARIGDLPRGHGILGLIIDKPEPLRLTAIGDHALSYGFPPNHPPMGSFLGVPIHTRGTVFGNLYLTEKQSGEGFTEEDEEIVVALAAAAGVVIENARLYEQTERRQRWLEAAAEVTAALLADLPRHDALQLVAERAREVAGADMATVLLRHEGGRLVVEAVAGPLGDGLVGSHVLAESSLAGDVLIGGKPLVVDDIYADDRVAGSGLGPDDGWPQMGSLMLLPLRAAGSASGIIGVGWSRGRQHESSDADLRPPSAFAEQTALALQVAQAHEDRARLAVFEDRDRIGRDLHDLVIQRLFAIGLTLQNATRLAVRPEVTERISTAVDDIDATIKDIRRTIFELSAPPATDLRAELAETIAVVVPALAFTPRLRTEGPVDTLVQEDIRTHLLAVLREMLTNVARHARATAAEVHLLAGKEIELTVRDNGKGFTDSPRESGLRNMRERAESLGGSFEIRRAEPGGTTAVWRVPAG